jgi:hypothetical protein
MAVPAGTYLSCTCSSSKADPLSPDTCLVGWPPKPTEAMGLIIIHFMLGFTAEKEYGLSRGQLPMDQASNRYHLLMNQIGKYGKVKSLV